jgi:hypothetical protein
MTDLTEDDFIEIGLDTAKIFGWRRCCKATSIDRFTKHYCVLPATCVLVWQDLKNDEKIDKRDKPISLLIALRFLFTYDTEPNLGSFFGILHNDTVNARVKKWVRKIQSLLQKKVSCSKQWHFMRWLSAQLCSSQLCGQRWDPCKTMMMD